MISFADTSMICALLREQDTTSAAEMLFAELGRPLSLSTLVAFEFRQSTRLQNFRFGADRTQGWPTRETERMLAQFDANLAAGAFVYAAVSWPDVHVLAERLSAEHTVKGGHRTLDVLHVATAAHVRADIFCTLDATQASLARLAGLDVRPSLP